MKNILIIMLSLFLTVQVNARGKKSDNQDAVQSIMQNLRNDNNYSNATAFTQQPKMSMNREKLKEVALKAADKLITAKSLIAGKMKSIINDNDLYKVSKTKVDQMISILNEYSPKLNEVGKNVDHRLNFLKLALDRQLIKKDEVEAFQGCGVAK